MLGYCRVSVFVGMLVLLGLFFFLRECMMMGYWSYLVLFVFPLVFLYHSCCCKSLFGKTCATKEEGTSSCCPGADKKE
jgi:hypothetical protein